MVELDQFFESKLCHMVELDQFFEIKLYHVIDLDQLFLVLQGNASLPNFKYLFIKWY